MGAALFYGTDLSETSLPLPRKASIPWALFHEESPMNNWRLIYEDTLTVFNYTSTYSAGSTWPIPLYWAPSWEVLVSRAAVPTAQKSQGELATVLFVQSNCQVASDRTRYVEELMKYISTCVVD